MHNTDNTYKQLVSEFTEQYMEKLFYFCLKKTGDKDEAEDLTQDIALNILCALNQGTVPGNFPAWVWQIARNRYAAWAKQKHRRSQSVIGLDISDYEIEDGDILEEMICSEQQLLFRREMALIRSDYRNLIVAYYLENQSMRDIAATLSLSLETVKKRIQRARTILKEGMDMARKFGSRSYQPEQVRFRMSGNPGEKGQPWTIINHLLYKNIFLEVCENPETAEELSLEMGIALPYMEDELEYLVKEELLRREGNKFVTNFPIISREEQRKQYEANRAVQKPLTDKMCEILELYRKRGGAKADVSYVGYNAAKWALLMRLFDWLFWDTGVGQTDEGYPSRPSNGAWTLTGYETIDWQEPAFMGLHKCLSYDEAERENEVDFGQYKFCINGYERRTPEFLTYHEGDMLWLVCVDKAENAEEKCLDRLLEYGYLKKADGKVEPNLVVFNWNAEETYSVETAARLSELKRDACALIRMAPAISRGYVIEQALADGWLEYDENAIPTLGAYIYL